MMNLVRLKLEGLQCQKLKDTQYNGIGDSWELVLSYIVSGRKDYQMMNQGTDRKKEKKLNSRNFSG